MNANIMNFASENDYGLVYVLTNSAMPGMVKIGMTQRADLEQRMKELYGTGVPVPFECAYACKVRTDKTKMLEHVNYMLMKEYWEISSSGGPFLSPVYGLYLD